MGLLTDSVSPDRHIKVQDIKLGHGHFPIHHFRFIIRIPPATCTYLFTALFKDAVKLYGVVILSTGHEMIPGTHAQDLVVDDQLLLPMPNAEAQRTLSPRAT